MHRPYVMVHCDPGVRLDSNNLTYLGFSKKVAELKVRGRPLHVGITSHGKPGDVFVPRHDIDVRKALESAGVKYEMVRLKIEGDPDPQKFRKMFNEVMLGKRVAPVEVKRVQPPPVETLKTEPVDETTGISFTDVDIKHAADLEEVRETYGAYKRAYERELRRKREWVGQPDLDAGKSAVGIGALLIVTHFLAGALGYLLGMNL